MYPGLPSRLEFDLRQLYLTNILKGDKSRAGKLKLHIEDPPQRKHMVFLGASVLGDIMANRPEFWMCVARWPRPPCIVSVADPIALNHVLPALASVPQHQGHVRGRGLGAARGALLVLEDGLSVECTTLRS